MAPEIQESRGRRVRRPRRDLGRLLARLLCFLFALIGAIPLTGGLLLRSSPLQQWAASETSRILRQELGVEATFSVQTSLIPLRLAVTDLVVPSTDGAGPAVNARLIAVSPRFFSLLAGRVDVGDIELEDTDVRLVVTKGKVQNVAYRFPETDATTSPEFKRAPFRSLAVTGARLKLDIDGTQIETDGIDLDAFAEENLSFDVALRLNGARAKSVRQVPLTASDEASASGTANATLTKTVVEEDRLCALDVRVLLSKEEILVRRLSLAATMDLDPAPGTYPKCQEDEPGQIALRLSQLKIQPRADDFPLVQGQIMTRVPLPVLSRFTNLPTTGWVGFSGEVAYDGSSRLPEVSGRLSGADMTLAGYGVAKHLKAEVLVTGDIVLVPSLDIGWGNGVGHLTGGKLEPLKEGMPYSVEKITGKDIDFQGTMRDLDITAHSWAEWNYGDSLIRKVKGTVSPFQLDGAITTHTRDFVMWDRGFDDPARARMVGIKQASIDGRFRAHSMALEFYNSELTFGTSKLPIDLVKIGLFGSGLIVRLKEGGGTLNLADVSPVAAVDLEGEAKIYVNLEGPNAHPVLDGTLQVDGLSIGGFPAGNIEKASVHFEPLYVEFSDLEGHKGAMDYQLDVARLSFDGPASVEFTTAVHSENFVAGELFNVFHFDEDPRFSGIAGRGEVDGRVRYLLGGPEDACGGGRLEVSGSTTLAEAELFGERFSGGNAEFSFEWFDMDAGTSGMRVEVPSLILRKGSGSLFGAITLAQGGIIDGDLVGTRIPISRIDAFAGLMDQTDGFVTGVGHVYGSVDQLAFSADVDVSTLKAGNAELGPSELRVRLDPIAPPKDSSTSLGVTGCGRSIPPEFSPEKLKADEPEGTFHVAGQLFARKITLDDITISEQQNKVIAGKAHINALDLGALLAFAAPASLVGSLPQGTMTGELNLEKVFLADPFASTAELRITNLSIEQETLKIDLADERARISIKDRSVRGEYLALRATTPEGQNGILDTELLVSDKQEIDATFDLRPTDLRIFAAALPGIERAEGALSASFALKGPILDPKVSGFLSIEDGSLHLSAINSPVHHLFLTVALDDTGLHVKEGKAEWGGGSVLLRGEAPLLGAKLGRTDLTFTARGVALRPEEHVRAAIDADLTLTIPAPSDESETLPLLAGTVDVLSGDYDKPMKVTADISSLTSRGEKTEVDPYEVGDDNLRIDVLVRSAKPLQVKNQLVTASLMIDPGGLHLTGTDEQLGAVGSVDIESGQVFLRSNEFKVQRGLVRFTDPTRMRPEVDVKAVTEYRRYQDRGATQAQAGTGTSTGSSTVNTAGTWRILLHVYGPPDELKVDMNSDPPLAQDDIFLLLTVGLTRTELDQTQNSGVGSSVALEALGQLSGAESAVTSTVPVDEFRFGTAYSSRSGRSEPTVTIGKRLSKRIRASVTTSVSESSSVRSNVEYRATDSLSVEGSWDNARDVASVAGGNLGGDVRWQLEFQ